MPRLKCLSALAIDQDRRPAYLTRPDTARPTRCRLLTQFRHGPSAWHARRSSLRTLYEGPFREVWILLVSAKWTALGRNKKGSKSWRQSKPYSEDRAYA